MALAAIEIYNKPTFPDREQVFSVLMINAWESLLKAKLLKDAKNRMTVLYIKEGRRYKRSRRTNQPLTIDFLTALGRCPVPDVAIKNLLYLFDVRNAATHLATESADLPLLVFSLGSAALKNYVQLCAEWFDLRLNQYNFYILPLGFSYPFAKLSALDLSKEPEDIATIIRSVVNDEHQDGSEDGFFLTCELQIALVSAKKVTTSTDLVAEIVPNDGERVIHRDVGLLDRYPYSFTDATNKIQKLNPAIRRNHILNFVKEQRIRGNPQYSAYNFRSNGEKQRGPSKTTAETQ